MSDPAPLRVCHLGKFYPPAWGGIETHVQTLARAQAALGAAVTVLCVNHRDRAGDDVTWRALARTPAVTEADGAVTVHRLARWLTAARLEVCPGLVPFVRQARHRFDVLHLHTPNPTFLLALAALPTPVPLVVTHHSDVIKQKVRGLILAPFERRLYQRARLILSDSPTYGDGSPTLQRFADKVRVLPLGIDCAPFAQPNDESSKWRERLGSPLWLSVGRLVYYKGLPNALRALAELPGRLLVIGSGPDEALLKKLAADLGVAERVTWQERATPEELTGAYHAATALLFPSNARSEGFGLVQVEAMAAGCPVLNAAIPASGVPWVSADGVSGLTTPVDDWRALAAAARRLLDEPGLRDRLAEQARRRAAELFDHEVMAQRSLDLYAEAQL